MKSATSLNSSVTDSKSLQNGGRGVCSAGESAKVKRWGISVRHTWMKMVSIPICDMDEFIVPQFLPTQVHIFQAINISAIERLSHVQ